MSKVESDYAAERTEALQSIGRVHFSIGMREVALDTVAEVPQPSFHDRNASCTHLFNLRRIDNGCVVAMVRTKTATR